MKSEFLDWLEVLPRFLPAEEVVRLYERVRDDSRRLEYEWRSEFERAFASHVSILPPPREI